MKLFKQVLILLLCCSLVRFTAQAESFGPAGQSNEQPPAPPVQHSPQELQQLVAPIALYPDALVAQILAASTYPTEIVEADRWMQSHANLKGEELAKEVDKQPWDPSVKALTQFPSVLENMDKNLSWTSSLGDAYANQQQDVTDAVQAMRQQAHSAGHLNSNEQQKVTTQGNTIIIEPANSEVVYVPAYDPWLVYGEPVVAYPGWYPEPGIFLAGAGIGFGIGFGVGFFGGYGWGWRALEVASTEVVVSMVAVVDDITDRMYRQLERSENSRMERNTMLHGISIFVQRECKRFVRFGVSVLFALSLGSSFAPTFAQQPGQRTFSSAEDASRALFGVMQPEDKQAALSILGPAGEDVLSSGDPQEDLDARVGFVVKYQEMHRFVTEANGTVTLVLGAGNWPFPIPLVKSNGSWYFDTAAGKNEIIFPRLGKNELAAIDPCR